MKIKIISLLLCIIQYHYSQDAKRDMVIITAEKISIEKKKDSSIDIDTISNYGKEILILSKKKNEFHAKYKVLAVNFGKYNNDTIDFLVYDEFELPEIERFNNILICLKKENLTYKFISPYYFDMYRTSSGKWASDCILPEWCDRAQPIKPERICFANPIKLNCFTKINAIEEFKKYYCVKNDSLIPTYGFYPDSLIHIIEDKSMEISKCVEKNR